MSTPRFPDDPAFKSLRIGDLEGYRQAVEGRSVVDFAAADLRGTDFRKADMSKVILKGAYLRDADLRGCDLRHLDLEGASIHNAKISGTYFPRNLSPAEIEMSLKYGTRLRVEPF
ncbi:MAG: pentapeptide repeat-containing protein [Rhodopirellula sp.]|nr:pentapeptide repeat-containing protein [Rhodopirellula sp.]